MDASFHFCRAKIPADVSLSLFRFQERILPSLGRSHYSLAFGYPALFSEFLFFYFPVGSQDFKIVPPNPFFSVLNSVFVLLLLLFRGKGFGIGATGRNKGDRF